MPNNNPSSFVISLRVNPIDAMSIIDTLEKLEVPTQNLSFAQATKLTLSSLLEAARQSGTIPRRSTGEYQEMIAPFRDDTLAARGAKLKIGLFDNEPVPQLDKGTTTGDNL